MGLVGDIAQSYRDIGNAQAQGAANSGAIWGGTLAHLGQQVAAIPGQLQQQKMQDQEMQIRQFQVDSAKRQQAAQDVLNAAYANALDDQGNVDMAKLAQAIKGTQAAGEWPKIQAGIAAAQEKTAQVAKLRSEIQSAERDQIAAIGNSADTAPDPETKAAVILAHVASGMKTGAISEEYGRPIIQSLIGQAGAPDPQAVDQTIARMKAFSASDVEKRAQAASAAAIQTNRAAELPGIQAESARKTKVEAGTSLEGITAEEQAKIDAQAASQKSTEAYRQAELRLSQQRLNLARQREAREGAQAQPVEIKPGSPEYRIAADLASGRMTFGQFRTLAAYNRNAALKFGIYDTARQLNPEFDPAGYELGFKMASNPQIRQRVVSINMLSPVIDKAEALAKQVGNGDVQLFNKILQGAKLQVSDRTVANYRQLQTLLGEEIGNALGLGTGSDLKTRLGLDLVNPNLSPKAFADTLEQLRDIMGSRRNDLIKQMGVYGGAAGGITPSAGGGTTPPPGAKMKTYNPTTGGLE